MGVVAYRCWVVADAGLVRRWLLVSQDICAHASESEAGVRAMEREHSYIVLNTDLSEEVVSDARPKFFPRGHVHDEGVDEGTTQNSMPG